MKKLLIILSLLSSLFSLTNVEYQKQLGIGIDVNWVLFPKEIKYYTSKIPKDFKNKGFDTIRLRFDFFKKKHNKFIKRDKSKYIKIIKKVINDCVKNHLNVVLSDAAINFKINLNKKSEKLLLDNWKLTAKEFKNYPYSISYDLIIEPGKNLSKRKLKNNWILNDFYKKAYKEIRSIDSKRIIMWAPNKLSNPFNLPKTWYPKNDKYIMAEWHMYAAGPKDDYEKMIPKKTKFAYEWSIKNHIPTWVGAWMPGNYNHGNTYNEYEQIKFSKFMIDIFKKYKIPSAINADQKFYNIKSKKFEYRLNVLNTIINEWKK